MIAHGLTEGSERRPDVESADPWQHHVPGGLAAAVEGVVVIVMEAETVFSAEDVPQNRRGEIQQIRHRA